MDDLFNFPTWYAKFRKETIRSAVVPFGPDFQAYLVDGAFVVEKDRFSELAAAVEHAIAELGGKVFVKLNFTAPTDAAWATLNRAMEVSSFEEALILLKASTRVHLDLLDPFHLGVPPPSPHIVLKRWFTYKREREFRVFRRGPDTRFIASRYLEQAPPLTLEHIEELLDAFLAEIAPKLGAASCIIDLYISPKLRVHIVDIAPWSEATHSHLFGWSELNTLENSETRLADGTDITPIEDSAVPVELMNGVSLDDIIASMKVLDEAPDQSPF